MGDLQNQSLGISKSHSAIKAVTEIHTVQLLFFEVPVELFIFSLLISSIICLVSLYEVSLPSHLPRELWGFLTTQLGPTTSVS